MGRSQNRIFLWGQAYRSVSCFGSLRAGVCFLNLGTEGSWCWIWDYVTLNGSSAPPWFEWGFWWVKAFWLGSLSFIFPLQSKWISCRPSPQKIAEDGKVIAPPYSSLTEEYMDNFGFACQASKNLNKSLNTGWVFLAKKLNFSHPTLIGPEQILNNVWTN